MIFADIPSVKMPLCATLFVVAKITTLSGENKILIRGDRVRRHYNLFNQLSNELKSKFVLEMLGGGEVRVFKDDKVIELFSCSDDFGREPNRFETAKIVQLAFPEFNIKVDE